MDHILVVDVEATCWEGNPPAGQESEIIEIGVCSLEIASGQRAERRSILVRPERSTVSAFCTSLTTLTQQQVEGGISFLEACALLKRDYRSNEHIWASYGEYDRQQFERQCTARGIEYPFGTRHLNVKSLFAIVQALSREVGMARAMELLKLPLEGTHHRGDDDAWNIALILSTLVLRARGNERREA